MAWKRPAESLIEMLLGPAKWFRRQLQERSIPQTRRRAFIECCEFNWGMRGALAAGAVFADGFVNERVQFIARQRNLIAVGFAALAGFRQLGAAAGRGSDEVPRAGGHQLGDFTTGKQNRLAGQLRGQRDFCEVLDGFHPEEGSEHVRTTRDRTVIGEKKRNVVRHKGLKGGAELGSSRRGVAHQRNLPKADDHFGEQRLVESTTGDGESGCGWRMRVTNGVYVRPHAVEKEMHGDFGRELTITGKLAAVEISDDEIFGRESAFVHAGRCCEDAALVETNGEIALAGDDESTVVHPAPRDANLAAVLFFAFHMAGQKRVRAHDTGSFLDRRKFRAETVRILFVTLRSGRHTAQPGN